jgi:predicted acyltransferase (DUF342 family)
MRKKVFICIFLIILCVCSMCFATDQDKVIPTTDSASLENLSYKDLYISDKYYKIDNTIIGNVFASTQNLEIYASNKGGSISGNLFVSSKSVNIESSKDNSTTYASIIYGNVFAISDNFTLDDNCEIHGDLYFCGKNIKLGNNAEITGNVFICAENVDIDSQIAGSLYINSSNFNMGYDCYISNDLKLNCGKAELNGQVARECQISANEFKSLSGFKVQKDLDINANKINFAGEVVGNANLKSKQISFNTTDNTCLIRGDLNYSASSQSNISSTNVLGKINYSHYSSNKFGKALLNSLISLCVLLTYIYGISFIINKFIPKLINNDLKISVKGFFAKFGIGLLFLILIPIIIILLFTIKIASLLAFALLALYALLLLISVPLFINTLANKYKGKKIYLTIFILSAIIWAINLIPYVGSIITFIVMLISLGNICTILFKKKD